MRAVYLRSVRSPHLRGGALLRDVARYRQLRHVSNVYSQSAHSSDDNDDYVEDSFCVKGNVTGLAG